MWPWDKIKELEEENKTLSRRATYLEGLGLSETDKTELKFLRDAIKDYVVYSLHNVGSWFSDYRYQADKTLQQSESDLTKARFYIAVLEAQMGPDGVGAAREVCERLKAVCGQKAIEQAKEA